MNYCTNKLEEIKNSISTENQQKSHFQINSKTQRRKPFKKNKPSNYPLVFINIDAENLFIKFLREANAIDKNNKPKARKFQPLCDAFFSVTSTELKGENILVYKALKIDYLKMLNNLFQIGKKNRLSSGEGHKDYVSSFLTKNKLSSIYDYEQINIMNEQSNIFNE